MTYIENPKFKGSGILACIPQTGRCPNNCTDCFFQSGRSYLEPLEQNLPNMPSIELASTQVVRVNDGHDSNIDRETVLKLTSRYPFKFYNTAILNDLEGFNAPVVLTLNLGFTTDISWLKVEPIPKNLMFVRMRVNVWNIKLVDEAVTYYTSNNVPIILTFMAYFNESIPKEYISSYIFRKRILNSYWAITTDAWRKIMSRYQDNPLVYSCGKIEGEQGTTGCRYCGNCLREFFVTQERMKI